MRGGGRLSYNHTLRVRLLRISRRLKLRIIIRVGTGVEVSLRFRFRLRFVFLVGGEDRF